MGHPTVEARNTETDAREEGYFLKTKTEAKPNPQEPPSSKTGTGKEGPGLLLIGIWVLLAGFAAPLLLIHMIKSPPPGEHLHIFGVSYDQMLFVFFLSSALMVYTSLFFLRVKPLTLLFSFILSLLSCFPFVVGLRNNLTLQQVILDIPFFSNWPFFVKPAYLLIECLIPLGIVIYLCLQIVRLLSKRPHGYAYLGVALYLSVAAFLGLSGLSQAQQPNLWTALAYMRGNLAEMDRAPVAGAPPSLPSPRESVNPLMASQARLPVPPGQMTPHVGSGDSGTGKAPAAPVSPAEPGEIKVVSKELRLLSEKVEGLMVQLGELKALLTARPEKGEEKVPVAATPEKRGEELSEEKRAILGLREELRILSDKVDHISGVFTLMGRVLAEQQGNMKKEGIGAGPDRSHAGKKKELEENTEKHQAR